MKGNGLILLQLVGGAIALTAKAFVGDIALAVFALVFFSGFITCAWITAREIDPPQTPKVRKE